MYKAKLKSWGVSKNLKAREAVALLRAMEQRQAAGEHSQVVVRGETHDLEWMKSYIKRNRNRGRFAKMDLRETSATTDSVATLIICSSPSTPAPSLESPGSQRPAEELFRSISVYIDGAFAAGNWFKGPDGLLRSCGGDIARHGPKLKDIWNRIDVASRLMGQSDKVDLVRLLEPGFANMVDVVREEYPRTIPFLVSCFEVLRNIGRTDLINTFLRYIPGLSGSLLGYQHPQTRIWTQLSAMYSKAGSSGEDAGAAHDDLLEQTFMVIIDSHRAQDRPSAAFEIAVYNDYTDAVLTRRDLETQERSLRRQLGVLEAMGEDANAGMQSALLRLRHAYAVKDLRMQQGRYAEAEVALDVLREYGDWDGAHGIKARAEARLAMGDLPAAEKFFREASELVDVNRDFKDEVWVLDVLENFGKVLILNDKPEEAAQVLRARQDRIERLSSESLVL
jgi:hypothetical protein